MGIFQVGIIAIAALLQVAHCASTCETVYNGDCLNWEYYKCTAGYITGACPGTSESRCCLPCNSVCVAQENGYSDDDAECTQSGGTCQDNSNYCTSSYSSGMCGGPSSRQCCGGSSGGGGGIIGGGGNGCTLVTYENSMIRGNNGLTVEVEPGFVSSMQQIEDYGYQCNLNYILVTHAFRYEGQSLGGTVVPPATYSNHLVGHAIDMNVQTPSGFCNGDCLYAGTNSYAECFVQKLLGDRNLRWGGIWSPSDPVHIDDGLNGDDPAEWDDLYYQLQGNC